MLFGVLRTIADPPHDGSAHRSCRMVTQKGPRNDSISPYKLHHYAAMRSAPLRLGKRKLDTADMEGGCLSLIEGPFDSGMYL